MKKSIALLAAIAFIAVRSGPLAATRVTVVTVAGTALTALGVSLVVRTPAAKPIAA